MTWAERVERRATNVSPDAFDFGLAVVFGVVALVSVYSQTVGPESRDPNALGVVAAVLGSAPIAVRRRYPLTALVISFIVTGVYFGVGFPEGSLPINCLVLTYSVAAWTPPAHAAVGLAMAAVGVIAVGQTDRPHFEAVNTLAFFVGAWLGGSAVRWRRETAAAELRAAGERAEIERQRSARLVAEERLRIAQELHDVVAHSMSVIAVQAGAGSHGLPDDTAQAQASLDAISSTSRATLTEMRRLLGVLRSEDGARANTPAPDLADLPQLIEDVRAVGVPATLEIRGRPETSDSAMQLSAYRIVQEALTNVIKHAGHPTEVRVALDYLPHELRIEVSDDGRGVAPGAVSGSTSTTGHGLIGMRERVDVWGGTFTSGVRPGGGYRTCATLPYGAPE